MNTIPLTEEDIIYARSVAKSIYDESRRQGLDPTGATGYYSAENEIIGVLGEIAAARHFGIPFVPNINQFKRPDVGKWAVRTTKYPKGKLLIRPGDPATDPYMLVTIPTFRAANIIGWIEGEDAMTDDNWYDKESIRPIVGPGDAAWVIFQDQLYSFTEFAKREEVAA